MTKSTFWQITSDRIVNYGYPGFHSQWKGLINKRWSFYLLNPGGKKERQPNNTPCRLGRLTKNKKTKTKTSKTPSDCQLSRPFLHLRQTSRFKYELNPEKIVRFSGFSVSRPCDYIFLRYNITNIERINRDGISISSSIKNVTLVTEPYFSDHIDFFGSFLQYNTIQ